jgi:hypothetical protein
LKLFFLLVAAGLANADTVLDWSYTDPSSNGSGTLTLAAGSSPYTVTGITGIWNGLAIIALDPVGSSGDNDNLLTYPGTPYVDGGGITFTQSDGELVNIYYFQPAATPLYGVNYYTSGGSSDGSSSGPLTDFTLSQTTVPEPAEWMLVAGGLAALALLRASA